MRTTSSRGWLLSCWLLAFLLAAFVSAEAQDTPKDEPTSEPLQRLKSSESGQPTSSSSLPATSEKQTPEQAFNRLLTEWEAFETAWLEFYPTLERWGIEFDELPSYLENLESSLVLEREARAEERKAAQDKAAADAIAVSDAETSAAREKNRKERWITVAGIGWVLAFLALIF